ncbi:MULTISPECIES: hypothetical protein [Heyndrickxia]|uniref:hypothetical protein n=1 Tax=Heyndrickxia TaxID=2837504 RepID=UPI0003A09079|nr:hypothetical protein [Heyndrickxia oleronia]MBU5211984.1 hypothetical protein [Heyndrickxia oleronia]MCI1591258.1 hypothetical protein [Heyndrickxia oleronia]MCI1615673.1 hypothetical protein [Heyndrickxia oleronia]MCI1746323.1 hypothetical protein [Heyndrickxia oleronia]MCI1763994.1 hypothetical protein [Heyndrickxia oleronia]
MNKDHPNNYIRSPNPYLHYPYPYHYPYRQYQPVTPQRFIDSANKMIPILKDAEKITTHISKSFDFSKRLMTLAQESKLNEVKNMLYQIGLSTKPDVRFTPSGLVLNFANSKDASNCCLLQLKIRWAE